MDAINGRGVRIRGEWFNVSQFRPAPLPEVGEYVRLKLQGKGFIDSVEVVKAAHDNGTVATGVSDRNGRITRLAVLNAAMFGASRPDLKSGDVLRIASSWLA